MPGKEYWQKRAETNLLLSEKNSERYIKQLYKTYNDSIISIDDEIRKVYNKYSVDNSLSKEEVNKLLNTTESKEVYDALLEKINKVKNKDYRQSLLSKYNAPAYSYRISRLEALKEELTVKINLLADKEMQISKENYINTINNSYISSKQLISDMKLTSSTNFQSINKKALNRILETNWLGSNFSTRIWNNSEFFTKQLNTILKSGLTTGLSYAKMSQKLKEVMNTSLYNATRLIRTETNHFHNEAEFQSYIDDGVTEYEYAAVLDSRTSDICRNLDGKIFKLSEKRVGVNYPPMHPFCRSTTLPVIDSIGKNDLTYDEEYAINSYVSSESYKINDKLRNNLTLDEYDNNLLNNLDSALDKCYNYNGEITRVLQFNDNDEAEKFYNSMLVEKTNKFQEYLSFSNKDDYNKDANVYMYCRNSKIGKDIRKYNPNESEILYPRNSTFKVIEKIKIENKYVIILEENNE